MLDHKPDQHTGLRLADLSRNQCRWPINHANTGELHMFCGEAVQIGHPYCDEHCRKAYTGKVPTR